RYIHTSQEALLLAERLKKADKMKDDFLANTSHELRNPLHGMLNIAELVLQQGRTALNHQSKRNLQLLLSIGQRMSLLLNDLIDMTRLREKAVRLHTAPIRLAPVVSSVIDMLRFMTSGKPVEFRMRITNDFPPVIADENRLVQILFNLLH